MSHFIPYPIDTEFGEIERIVSRAYEISPSDFSIMTRLRTISEARAVVCFIRMRAHGESEHSCGRRFNQDHTTMNHAKKRIPNLYWSDRGFRKKMDSILRELNLTDMAYSMGLEKP